MPEKNLLGKEGEQIWYVFNVIAPYFLVAMAGTYVGVARRALNEARDHMLKRVHSHTGEPLARLSVLHHKLGTLWSNLERTSCLLHSAAQDFDSGSPDAVTAICELG